MPMGLLKIAQIPPPTVEPQVSVMDAVTVMAANHVGAVVVVEKKQLLGIFTERDLMMRVVHEQRDPATTLVRDVMTTDVMTVTEACTHDEASTVMTAEHLRHLPILDGHGKVLGLLSMRALLEERLEDLSRSVSSMEQYLANDGPGG
jgi:CBS domain-containing protein